MAACDIMFGSCADFGCIWPAVAAKLAKRNKAAKDRRRICICGFLQVSLRARTGAHVYAPAQMCATVLLNKSTAQCGTITARFSESLVHDYSITRTPIRPLPGRSERLPALGSSRRAPGLVPQA